MNRSLVFAALSAILFATATLAAESSKAFVGATLLPVSGPRIDNGVMVVEAGRIKAIGPRATTPIPKGAVVIDLTGKTVIPGLVDTHSHIGGVGGADRSAALQPDVRVYDSLNPLDSGFRRAVAGGLTTLNVMPGSGHLLSGQTVYLKLRGGRTIESLFYRRADGQPAGGIKMANGTNSIDAPPFPGTRGKSASMQRELFVRAQEYRDKLARAGSDVDKRPPRDIGLEAVVEALEGKRVVHFHTHRADDIMTVLRLKKEFGLRVVLQHVSEGWKVADEIAAAGAPCSIILVDAPGGKLETANIEFETAKVLEQKKVNVAFHTDDWITDSRLFLRMAALGVRAGMSRDAALRALTLAGAEMLDLSDRVGSLAVGKDADFVVLSGDPFSVYTQVLQTWVEGQSVFDRNKPEDRLMAVGGYGAGDDQQPYFCCMGRDAQ
ncbi:MAG: amidohydrolase family protein [Acidobacteriota bacterium]